MSHTVIHIISSFALESLSRWTWQVLLKTFKTNYTVQVEGSRLTRLFYTTSSVALHSKASSTQNCHVTGRLVQPYVKNPSYFLRRVEELRYEDNIFLLITTTTSGWDYIVAAFIILLSLEKKFIIN